MKTVLLKYTIIYFSNWINEPDIYENEECSEAWIPEKWRICAVDISCSTSVMNLTSLLTFNSYTVPDSSLAFLLNTKEMFATQKKLTIFSLFQKATYYLFFLFPEKWQHSKENSFWMVQEQELASLTESAITSGVFILLSVKGVSSCVQQRKLEYMMSEVTSDSNIPQFYAKEKKYFNWELRPRSPKRMGLQVCGFSMHPLFHLY